MNVPAFLCYFCTLFSLRIILNDHLNQATKFYSLWYIVLNSSVCLKSLSMTIKVKATEQYFPLVMFIMLYKVVPSFESICG